ncbi:MAG: 30S ribosomal protein S8 [Candidatus Doudnabacteria bacterium]|nr:30S ribosomal protein S8 [Candidatus Doudnabacteria bacterium]
MTDPISDMLTQIRNAIAVGKTEVILPYSHFKKRLGEILVKQGLLEELFTPSSRTKQQLLGLKLRYTNGKSVIGNLERVSRPGQRIYKKADQLPHIRSGFGLTIISTSKGLYTDKEARKEHLGGEVICQIW